MNVGCLKVRLTALFHGRACSHHLLHCVQALIDALPVGEGVSHPVAQQAPAKGRFGMVHQPKQGPLFTATIIVAQHLKLPAALQVGCMGCEA